MDAIVDFLSGIGDAVISLFSVGLSFVGDIVYLVGLTGSFLVQIPSYFSWLPAPVVALLTTIFVVVVLYKILGREG